MSAEPRESCRITIRISCRDKEMLEELAEIKGTTVSEIVRGVISNVITSLLEEESKKEELRRKLEEIKD